MSRRIYNINLNPMVHNGCIFGKDRNTSFALQIVRIHHTLLNRFIFPENAALA